MQPGAVCYNHTKERKRTLFHGTDSQWRKHAMQCSGFHSSLADICRSVLQGTSMLVIDSLGLQHEIAL